MQVLSVVCLSHSAGELLRRAVHPHCTSVDNLHNHHHNIATVGGDNWQILPVGHANFAETQHMHPQSTPAHVQQ